MIKQVSQFMQPCPVCGRSLKVASEYFGSYVTCQHCRGRFVAGGADAGLDAACERVSRALRRADRLLAMSRRHLSSAPRLPSTGRISEICPSGSPTCAVARKEPTCTGAGEQTSCQLQGAPANGVLTVLLVEHRDEVFRRLAADIAAAGFLVVRAENSTDAIARYVRHPSDLLMVSGDRTSESAWLLIAKLHLTHSLARVWVYMRRLSTSDRTAANLLLVEELIEYGASMSRLSDEITGRLAERAVLHCGEKAPQACAPTAAEAVANV